MAIRPPFAPGASEADSATSAVSSHGLQKTERAANGGPAPKDFRTVPAAHEICRHFLRKRCWQGESCHRIHPLFYKTRATIDEVCINFIRNRCTWGENCRRIHVYLPSSVQQRQIVSDSRPCLSTVPQVNDFVLPLDPFNSQSLSFNDLMHDSDSKTPITRLRPRPSENLSQNMALNYDELCHDEKTNFWGPPTDENAWANTSMSSDDSLTDGDSSTISTTLTVSSQTSASTDHSQRIKHPPPPSSDICHNWLRDRCQRGYDCRFVHGDLEYDAPEARKEGGSELPFIDITIHDHTKVKLGAGFEIHDVTTSVENPWIVLGNVPARVKIDAIRHILSPFGSVLDIRPPFAPTKDVMTVSARFSSHAEALQASTTLNDSMAFKRRITARIPVNSRSGKVSIRDSTVHIYWEAPQRVAYGGYPTAERAQEAIAMTRKGPCGDYNVHGYIHVGLPSIGAVTVKFTNLPPDSDDKFMERFCHPEDIMWERPNYLALRPAVDGIKRILDHSGSLLELDVLPPPYSYGFARCWATFSSSSAARSTATFLHGRMPFFTGHTRIFARHVQTLIYVLPLDIYQKHVSLICALREAATAYGPTATVALRRQPLTMIVNLSAEEIKELGQLKVEFEKILHGEILRSDGVAVWDGFFARTDGVRYLHSIEMETRVRIETDLVRRNIKLFGTPDRRAAVRTMLLQKLTDVQAQQERKIRVPGRVANAFIITQLSNLCRKFGAENIFINGWERIITFRGDEVYKAGTEALHQARQSLPARPTRQGVFECPVCFNPVVSPVTLPCGHTWCRNCLAQYLLAAVDNRNFPLKCLGDEAKCTEHIPLSIALSVLQHSEFNLIVDAALSSYVHAHAKELHYCPSPDCLQIYRTGPKGTVVQCPACLLRICPHCHSEAHDEFPCVEQDGGDKLFKEWAARHDVKHCPGCAVPIERDEGCYHITCIQCRTHICWVCLKTFPKGEGIYEHMRAEHGGIGLGQDF
ncbi:hypothetical protein GGX14DRAFT_455994 [Mycena pura]|uniref:RBR-type E3 ubiquitin transferase n=1 Tax=Mycena pura TaxID=153505 RepID=A0AAD6Y8C4_9AGAR|nr:hypothetical protein GGX14DRAFT_455994 [Mycena pura]